MKPRYPIFVPSKGRADSCSTARFLLADETPFRLVVEPSEADAYAAAVPEADLLVTPKDEMRLLGVRNWIRDLSVEEGAARHWQIDDNCLAIWRWHKGERIPVGSSFALACMEDFTDRYTNVGISGPNYVMFGTGTAPPFRLNTHVYSCSLIDNTMPFTWRLLYNDDTDLCLQVLAGGLCTIQFQAFLIQKIRTMVVKGGNTEDLYQGDGRLLMARSLERVWPGVVTTERRFGRPQHVIRDNWRRFTTPLIPRPDLDLENLDPAQYAMTLTDLREAPAEAQP